MQIVTINYLKELPLTNILVHVLQTYMTYKCQQTNQKITLSSYHNTNDKYNSKICYFMY
jgi:hypothetical protein